MAGSYYVQADTKLILTIASGDTADDNLLDDFGNDVNQRIDNILIAHDERIPLSGGALLNDLKTAANYEVAGIYKAHRGDLESAAYWHGKFKEVIDAFVKDKEISGNPYLVERFNDRYRQEDVYALW